MTLDPDALRTLSRHDGGRVSGDWPRTVSSILGQAGLKRSALE